MKIKELLSSHHKWCKEAYAKTSNGTPVHGDDEQAVRFCLLGAIDKCYQNKREKEGVLKKVKIEIGARSYDSDSYVGAFNDESDFRTVKELVDKLDI